MELLVSLNRNYPIITGKVRGYDVGFRPDVTVNGYTIPGEHFAKKRTKSGKSLLTHRDEGVDWDELLKHNDAADYFGGIQDLWVKVHLGITAIDALINPPKVIFDIANLGIGFFATGMAIGYNHSKVEELAPTILFGQDAAIRTNNILDAAIFNYVKERLTEEAQQEHDVYDANEVVVAALGRGQRLAEERIEQAQLYISRNPHLNETTSKLKRSIDSVVLEFDEIFTSGILQQIP